MSRRKRREKKKGPVALREFILMQEEADALTAACEFENAVVDAVMNAALSERNFQYVVDAIFSETVAGESVQFAIKGGLVRDVVQAIKTEKPLNFNDIDCICNLDINQLTQRLTSANIEHTGIYGRFHLVIIILDNGRKVDIAPMGADYSQIDFENPVAQCDFKMNGAFVTLMPNQEGGYEGELHDYTGVCTESDNKIDTINENAATSFTTDPFRILRAIYYAIKLNRLLSDNVIQGIAECRMALKEAIWGGSDQEISGNPRRALREINKIFSLGKLSETLKFISKYRLKGVLFPNNNTNNKRIYDALDRSCISSDDAEVRMTILYRQFKLDLDLLYSKSNISTPAKEVVLECVIARAKKATASCKTLTYAEVAAKFNPMYSQPADADAASSSQTIMSLSPS